MYKKWLSILVIALATVGFAVPSQAALEAVDPGPYTAATGFFPLWYRDGGTDPADPSTKLTLDLCLSKAVSPNGGGFLCTLLPTPGVFDETLPIVFPLNFPDEAFWFTADATIVQGGIDLSYGAALEAAFANELPAQGDQVSFARIRIRVDVPTAGTYTVTHPYGVETFNVTTPGRRAINMTRDIGIGAPGVFTGALGGDVGPFLRRNGPLITAVDPVTGLTDTFVGDPNVFETVTGSTLIDGNGNPQNYVRIQGPNGIDFTTDLFSISGRIWNNLVPTAVTVDRSTYKRSAGGETKLDVFAASSPTATVSFRETVDPAASTELPMTGDGVGSFYAQDPAPPTLPLNVIVTAADAPATTPSLLASPVVDVVKITQALYAKGSQALLIQAKSSDEQEPIPTLRAVGLPGTLQSVSGTTTQQILVAGVTEPPATITVKSSAGGSDTEPVQVVDNVSPVAVDDSATTVRPNPVVIDVLANDTDFEGDLPLTVASLTQPAVGEGTVSTDGTTVTYTPNANFTGITTFTYRALDSRGGLSNIATVTVTINNLSPIATADTASTTFPTPVTISVLANDADPDGDIPLTVVNLTQPSAGAGSVTTNGTTVTYTPGSTFSGTATFTYRAQDSRGGLSNVATVTVSVARVPVDVDISAFNATSSIRLGRGQRVTLTLDVINRSTVSASVPATVVGVRNGVTIYSQTLQVSDPPGGLSTRVTFPAYTPTVAGNITWTATLQDENADVDSATRTTTVR